MKMIKRKNLSRVVFSIILISLIAVMFGLYQSQIKNLTSKQLELQNQIKELSDNSKSRDRDSLSRIEDLEKEIIEIRFEQDNEDVVTHSYLEDELNNRNNCVRLSGNYQGNGLCTYH